MKTILYPSLLVLWIWVLIACGNEIEKPVPISTGPHPVLPAAETNLIPTVNIANAIGWPKDVLPQAATGLQVNAFARDFDHPRWLYVLPNGDVLVAETNAPAKKASVKKFFMNLAMKKAGASVPSANRISLLRDTDNDGIADFRSVLLQDLNSPFGMALIENTLYVANTDAIVKFPYQSGDTVITAPGVKVIDLPAEPINHHWTKNIIANADGTTLYVTIGSNSNIGENGMAAESERAAIWQVNLKTGKHQIFASGLRNPNGLAWEPSSKTLWTVVNERDGLGNDLVPDYLTSVREGGFYGWPYSYYGQHVDTRVSPQRPALVAQALRPDYALGSHVAPLGLTSSVGATLPAPFTNGMFVGQHGSWNRKPHSGYNVVFIPFNNAQAPAQPSGTPIEVLSGFLSKKGEAYGRPVGVVIDKKGALLVADDVGNIIWRVATAGNTQ
ncbi:MAG: sorbosone dehydrogenase family protein [Gammaproteobacteria bacterium]|nr:sorbosone dehydrogenase family protein [Gammaproteobacteria bacterium]